MSTATSSDERLHDDAPVTVSKIANPDRALLAEAVTINRAPAEFYEFWRDPANLVQVMENIVAIEPTDNARSRWTVCAARRAPGGGRGLDITVRNAWAAAIRSPGMIVHNLCLHGRSRKERRVL